MTKNSLTSTNLSVKIFDSITSELEKDWINLTNDQEVFAQSHCEWIKAWCDVKKLTGKLHIIAFYSETSLVGIAPFKLDKSFLGNTLQSIPIHFGDFISCVTKESYRKEVFIALTHYLQEFKCWSFIKIDNVCSIDDMYSHLQQNNFQMKLLSKAHIVGFGARNFDDYLMSLSKNRRNKTNKQIRQVKKLGELEFEVVVNFSDYERHFNEMRNVYVSRWGKDINEHIYQYRNLALSGLFPKGIIRLFLLKLNGRIIGYHLGFVFDKYFYSWKEAAHSDYSDYSIGNMVRVFFIPQYLIENDIEGINFMAGDYEYKSNRVGDDGRIDNISQFYCGKGLFGYASERYYSLYRDQLKSFKERLIKFKSKLK